MPFANGKELILRQQRGYVLFSQAIVLGFEQDHPSAKIAGELLDIQKRIIGVPVYSKSLFKYNDDDKRKIEHEVFHGVLFCHFEDSGAPVSTADKLKLNYIANAFGDFLGAGSRENYWPVVTDDKDRLQRIENAFAWDDKGVRSHVRQIQHLMPAKPELVWPLGDALHDTILKNTMFYEQALDKYSGNALLTGLSPILKKVFQADTCFFLEYKGGNEFKIIGSADNGVQKAFAMACATSLIKVPLQTRAKDTITTAIPQFCNGNFIGSLFIKQTGLRPRYHKDRWEYMLHYLGSIFEILYGGSDKRIRSKLYETDLPWYAFIELLDSHYPFPPTISHKAEDFDKFGVSELKQLTEWYANLIQMSFLPSPIGKYKASEQDLKEMMPPEEAAAFYSATTTTIMDLCSFAGKSDWDKTQKIIFGEFSKLFGFTAIDFMWFATYQGNGRFEIYHSGDNPLDEKEKLVCEALAQWTALNRRAEFVPADGPELIHRLVRKTIGEESLVTMPVCRTDRLGKFEWAYTTAVFCVALNPERKKITVAEWTKWLSITGRSYAIIEAALKANKISFCNFGMPEENEMEKKWYMQFMPPETCR
ncbi:MAG: hypothetical protein HYU98_01725 [Deltaproteobacteria bacterium]|nr:hypothetical protein [Deltaproteobacteria bacterium]